MVSVWEMVGKKAGSGELGERSLGRRDHAVVGGPALSLWQSRVPEDSCGGPEPMVSGTLSSGAPPLHMWSTDCLN